MHDARYNLKPMLGNSMHLANVYTVLCVALACTSPLDLENPEDDVAGLVQAFADFAPAASPKRPAVDRAGALAAAFRKFRAEAAGA